MKKIISSILSLCLILNLVYINPHAAELNPKDTQYNVNLDTIYKLDIDTSPRALTIGNIYNIDSKYFRGVENGSLDWSGLVPINITDGKNFPISAVDTMPFKYLGEYFGKKLLLCEWNLGTWRSDVSRYEKLKIFTEANNQLGNINLNIAGKNLKVQARLLSGGDNEGLAPHQIGTEKNEYDTIKRDGLIMPSNIGISDFFVSNYNNTIMLNNIRNHPDEDKNGWIYSDQSGARVVLEIINTPPIINNITHNPSLPTNTDVAIHISATDTDGDILSFRINGSAWQTSPILSVSSNGTYTIDVSDGIDTVSSSATISNIDKTMPILNLSQSPTTPTNTDVIISATATDNESGMHSSPYSYDGGITWVQNNTLTVANNGTYQVMARDVANNITTGTITISNIDKTPPILNLSQTPTIPTNTDIVILATATDSGLGLHKLPYSFDGGITWVQNNTLTVANNGTYQVMARDVANNIATANITISNVDKISPTILSVTHTENKGTLKVSVHATDNNPLNYSFDGGLTFSSSNIHTTDKYDKLNISVKDLAGNITSTEYTPTKVTVDIISNDYLVNTSLNKDKIPNINTYISNKDTYSVDISMNIYKIQASDSDLKLANDILQRTNEISETLDISVIQTLIDKTGTHITNIKNLTDDILININIPENLKNKKDIKVIRIHDGVAEILDTIVDRQFISFETDKFSTYFITYKREVASIDDEDVSIKEDVKNEILFPGNIDDILDIIDDEKLKDYIKNKYENGEFSLEYLRQFVVPYTIEGVNKIIAPKSIYKDGKVIYIPPVPGRYKLMFNFKEFDDIIADENVAFVSAREILIGRGNKIFSPKDNITRAEFAAAIARVENYKSHDVETNYLDIDGEYNSTITWIINNKIMVGNGINLFRPNDLITREEMSITLENYYKYLGENKSFYTNENTNITRLDSAKVIKDMVHNLVENNYEK